MLQSIALQKRLCLLLTRQIQKLTTYAQLLDMEELAIRELDIERLTNQQQAEKLLVSELVALEKVIQPLEKMLNALNGLPDSGIDSLKEKLLLLKEKVLSKNARTQQLAEGKLNSLNEERLQLRKNKLHSFAPCGQPYNQPSRPSLLNILQ